MTARRGSVRRAICGAVVMAIGFGAGPAVAQAACKDADLVPTARNSAKTSKAILCLVNQERTSRGLKALRASGQLRRAARRHSRDMVAKRYFDHVSPSGSTIVARVRATGYLRGAKTFVARENLAWARGSAASPRKLVTDWMGSSIHRGNILLRSVRQVGIGLAQGSPTGGSGTTVTMVLGARRR